MDEQKMISLLEDCCQSFARINRYYSPHFGSEREDLIKRIREYHNLNFTKEGFKPQLTSDLYRIIFFSSNVEKELKEIKDNIERYLD